MGGECWGAGARPGKSRSAVAPCRDFVIVKGRPKLSLARLARLARQSCTQVADPCWQAPLHSIRDHSLVEVIAVSAGDEAPWA